MMAVRHQIPPLAGQPRVGNVQHAVDGEEPHEEEVERHTLGEVERYAQRRVEPTGKEVDQRRIAQSEAIDVIGPVD
jgi:hypothetical protein